MDHPSYDPSNGFYPRQNMSSNQRELIKQTLKKVVELVDA
jgi:hypothetical protein